MWLPYLCKWFGRIDCLIRKFVSMLMFLLPQMSCCTDPCWIIVFKPVYKGNIPKWTNYCTGSFWSSHKPDILKTCHNADYNSDITVNTRQLSDPELPKYERQNHSLFPRTLKWWFEFARHKQAFIICCCIQVLWKALYRFPYRKWLIPSFESRSPY